MLQNSNFSDTNCTSYTLILDRANFFPEGLLKLVDEERVQCYRDAEADTIVGRSRKAQSNHTTLFSHHITQVLFTSFIRIRQRK